MDRAGDRHRHMHSPKNHCFSPRSGQSSSGGLMSPIQSTCTNNNNDFSTRKMMHTPTTFNNLNQDQGDHQSVPVPTSVKKPVVRLLRRPSGVYIPEKSLASQLSSTSSSSGSGFGSSSNSGSSSAPNARFTSKAPTATPLKSPRNMSSMTKGHINVSSSSSSTASMRTPRSPCSPRKFLWKKNEVDIESYCETRPSPSQSPSPFTTDDSTDSFNYSKRKNRDRKGQFGKILELDEEDVEKDHFYLESENGRGKTQLQLPSQSQSQGDGKQAKKSVSSCTVDGLGFDLETIDLTNDTDRRVINKHGISSNSDSNSHSSSSASSPSSSESSIKKTDKSTRHKQDPNKDAYETPQKPESESSGSSDNDTRSARRYISVESLVLEDNFNATTTSNTNPNQTSASASKHHHHHNNKNSNCTKNNRKGGTEKQSSSSCKTTCSSSSSSSSDGVEAASSSSVTLIKNVKGNPEEEEIPQVKVAWTTPPQSSPRKNKDKGDEDEDKNKTDSDSNSKNCPDPDPAPDSNNIKTSTKNEKQAPNSGSDNDSIRDNLNILNFFTRTEDGVEKEGRFEHVQPNIDKFFTTSSSSSDDENSNTNGNANSNSNSGSGGLTKSINLQAVLDNMDEFVLQPAAIGFDVQCRVTRDRKGVDRGLYPTYYMHLERSDGRKILLLTGRKRKKSTTSNYLISTDAADLSRDSNHFVGKVRSNLLGTQFTIYDNGQSHKRFGLFQTYGANAPAVREELAAVIYEPNVLGFKGPRKMKILIPEMKNEVRRREHRPDNEKDSILELYKQGDAHEFFELKNKAPIWNDDNQSFVLNFHGRVTQASVKNFQVIHDKKADYVLLQFGRIASDLFTMDYRYPLCALQAFAIVLTSFDNKLACE